MEFKNMTKMDALKTLNSELEKLKKTSTSEEEKKSFEKNFDGFQNLFRKYLEADVSAPISWEKIEKLPTGSVSTQCGNLMIFLSLRFCVKSILGILEVQNLPF